MTIVVNDKTKTYDGTEYTGYTISSVTGTGETITTEDYTVTGLANGERSEPLRSRMVKLT